MSQLDWSAFLSQWNVEMLVCADIRKQLPKKMLESDWLGTLGATEDQIIQAEARLGVHLPPSYRAFLHVSNGWQHAGFHIHTLWSVEHIDWYATRHLQAIELALRAEKTQALLAGLDTTSLNVPDERYFVYGDRQETINIRSEYLKGALEISEEDPGGDGVCLLNPAIRTSDGEWEAWFFAHWLPGARRYRSFWELMLGEYDRFLDIRAQDHIKKGRYYYPQW